ncbi:MAG: GRP family sugar transporter [Cyclobacteriaceae bacterium]|nr:MAG: GRP family sugar transporter [Cyclobacteriaceae bacterium]
MYIVNSYSLAILFTVITMLCWGSWGNTQKLAAKTWRFELFYWDYVIGILLLSVLIGLTLGSTGEEGRGFVDDLVQISAANIGSAILGGIIFNASNILLSASISIAGMAVAFPLGVGIALVLGVVVNYISEPKGDPIILFLGVSLVMVAIIFNGIASGKMNKGEKNASSKGIRLALIAGVLMSFFYRFVAAAMDVNNFESPTVGMATPYTAFFLFALGVFLSNFLFNTIIMKKPFVGIPVTYGQYFNGSISTHFVGITGGAIWGLGTILSFLAAGKAGAAISYGLGQGATLVAALWGVFIWKEFKGGSKMVNLLLIAMFLLFISGLILIITAGNN